MTYTILAVGDPNGVQHDKTIDNRYSTQTLMLFTVKTELGILVLALKMKSYDLKIA